MVLLQGMLRTQKKDFCSAQTKVDVFTPHTVVSYARKLADALILPGIEDLARWWKLNTYFCKKT